MSVALTDEVLRLRMAGPTEKLVLLAFAGHSGDDELAFPSIDLVAAQALCSGRTVQRIIRQLVDDGFLTVVRRASGRGYPTGYRVNPEAAGPIPAYRELREEQRASSHSAAQGSRSDLESSPQQSLLPVDNSQKGDTQVSPFSAEEKPELGDKSALKGDKNVQKGDTAVSPEPLTFNHRERSEDRPVDSSRAAGAQDPPERSRSSPPVSQLVDQSPGQSPPRSGSAGDRGPPSRSAAPAGGTATGNRGNGKRPRGYRKRGDSKSAAPVHPNHYNPEDYRDSMEQVTEKARKHALPRRRKSENDFAFRNRIAVCIHDLSILENECRRLSIRGRKPGESFDDFEFRVERAAMLERGMSSGLTASQARKQALATR